MHKPVKVDQRTAAPSANDLAAALTDSRAASVGVMLRLQRTAGNRAVAHFIQTKLTVGPAHDQYEQEADRVAQQVMTMPTPIGGTQPAGADHSSVQREAAEEEEVQMKPLAASITPLVQRQAEEEEEIQAKPIAQRQPEEEELQMKPAVQRQEDEDQLQMTPAMQRLGEGGFEVNDVFEQQLAASRGSGSPLPASAREFMEPRFGADFSGVRVHSGSESAQLNRSVSANAFTIGQDIYLGEGKSDVTSAAGKELLAHELTHVIQQQGPGMIHRQMALSNISRAAGVIQRVWANTVEHAISIRDKGNIRLYDDRLAHIIEEHASSGGEGRDRVGRFNTDTAGTIKNYVLDTIQHGTPKLGPRSAYDFECDFTGPIGTNDAGAESKRVRVVVVQATQKNDNVGKVQTAYPI
jgi:hypothetical protein